MKAKCNLVYLTYPNRIIVCESSRTDNQDYRDPETGDLREYARIVPRTQQCGYDYENMCPEFEYAGTVEWTKHATMLEDWQREQIIVAACAIAETDKENTRRCKEYQKLTQDFHRANAAKRQRQARRCDDPRRSHIPQPRSCRACVLPRVRAGTPAARRLALRAEDVAHTSLQDAAAMDMAMNHPRPPRTCRQCPLSRRCLNGLYCTSLKMYLEYQTTSPCQKK